MFEKCCSTTSRVSTNIDVYLVFLTIQILISYCLVFTIVYILGLCPYGRQVNRQFVKNKTNNCLAFRQHLHRLRSRGFRSRRPKCERFISWRVPLLTIRLLLFLSQDNFHVYLYLMFVGSVLLLPPRD